MVDMVMMYKHQKHQQKQQKQEQQQQNKWKTKNVSKSGEEEGGGGFLPTLKQTNIKTNRGSSISCCRGGGGGVAFRGARSIGKIWFVLVVFMLILCGNTVISQQRNINSNSNNNNNSNVKLNNSSNNNILLQISTPSYYDSNTNNDGTIIATGGDGGVGGSAGIIVVDEVEKLISNSTKTTTSTTSSSSSSSTAVTSSLSSSSSVSASSASSSSSASNNAPTLGITNTDTKIINLSSNNDSSLNDGESISGSSKSRSSKSTSTSTSNNSNEDLFNSSEILNESEDGYENSSMSPTTYRPLRASVAPYLTSAQERERRLMNVLAARRTALQRPGFRNRIGTTGRTATAVETTSKSPTDPRSVCIRNCTKNFTRRTTASCMRQCANFSRVGNTGGTTSVVIKASSKTGLGTSQAGERDTNEILFTDESSHGLLVIAKEQNDTLNHITDEIKGGTATKYRGRRKPSQAGTVTLATTSVEDDEIQPYLYFGQKLPPLKPNALTITSVSDEHPKLLEVSVADEVPSSTTPVSLTSASTLSAVERSRARYKYNMRNGNNFNRRYSSINRATTPEVPTDIRTTTLRIVAKTVSELNSELPIQIKNAEILRTNNEAMKEEPIKEDRMKEEPIISSTPLIITVLSDEEMLTPIADILREENLKLSTTLATTSTTESTTSTTTEKSTSTSSSTTTYTSTTAPSTTSTTTSTTTTTPAPFIYQEPKITFISTLATPTTSSSSTTTPISTSTKKPIIIDEDTELLRKLGPSLTQPINTDDKTNLIIFVNRTSGVYRPRLSTSTMKPLQGFIPNSVTTDSSTILRTTVLTSIRSTVNPRIKDYSVSTTPIPMASSQKGPLLSGFIPSSSTIHPIVTGEISSTVVTDDQEISLEMQRMNIVTMVLAGIGIVPLLAIILYLLRNYLLKRPIKDDEDFDVCITDQQPISPVKKLESKYQEEDEDEVDHHKKPPQRQHSLHSKLVTAPLSRDNNHNIAQNHQQQHHQQQHQQQQQQQHQRYDDKSSVTSDHEFDRSNIRLKSLLGEGNFGQVWKAEADDLSGHFGATRIVAVKTIKACSTQLSLKDEANIMRKLGSHQNVVTLLGACVDSEPHMLIMEYAMRGRLLSLLRAARNATNILPASVPGGRSLAPLSPRTLAGFCLDIACGMEYISEKRIVHRDLAARNVLLDHNGVCKICDFGMSIDLDAERKRKEQEKNCANEIISRSNFNKFKFDFGGKFIMNHWTPHTTKDTNEKKSHGHDTIGKRPALPIRWMAPEALQYNMFSTETDIWAFGIVLWEIATLGSTPYSQITGREVIRRVPQGLRPDLPKEGRHEFYNLMSRCWHKDSQMRPSFSQCRLEISRSLHKWVDDDSAASDYMDVSGFSEDLEQGMVYFNHRISEFECEI